VAAPSPSRIRLHVQRRATPTSTTPTSPPQTRRGHLRAAALTMRLRLHIVRKDLPARKVLWTSTSPEPSVGDDVSSLLRSINGVIPLQSANCRLEDYVVELDGFEVLGFQKVSAVFEKDDVVVYFLLKVCCCLNRTDSGLQYPIFTPQRTERTSS
jgi:hypothetical protein